MTFNGSATNSYVKRAYKQDFVNKRLRPTTKIMDGANKRGQHVTTVDSMQNVSVDTVTKG